MLDDNGLRGNDLIVTGGGWVLSTAPIGEDTPLARNAVLGLRTRFNGMIDSSPVGGRVRRAATRRRRHHDRRAQARYAYRRRRR